MRFAAGFLLLGACGFRGDDGPGIAVREFTRQVRSGASMSVYRNWIDGSVDDSRVADWVTALRDAFREHGSDLRYTTVSMNADEAHLKVTIASGKKPRPFFEVRLARGRSGWWIHDIDLTGLDVGEPEPSGSFGAQGGGRRSRRR